MKCFHVFFYFFDFNFNVVHFYYVFFHFNSHLFSNFGVKFHSDHVFDVCALTFGIQLVLNVSLSPV